MGSTQFGNFHVQVTVAEDPDQGTYSVVGLLSRLDFTYM